jgi:hypothetical protein
MPNFSTTLSDKEYKTLRTGSMKGQFTYDFVRTGSRVDFKVTAREPYKFFEEMTNIIDPGETTWEEIFMTNKNDKITHQRCN